MDEGVEATHIGAAYTYHLYEKGHGSWRLRADPHEDSSIGGEEEVYGSPKPVGAFLLPPWAAGKPIGS